MFDKKVKKEIKKDLKVQEKQNLEIGDRLAMERTKFANERTFLAYTRTALAMILAGLTFLKIFQDPIYMAIGIFFIPLGIGFGLYGYRRFTQKQAQITGHTQSYTPTSHVHAQVAQQEKTAPDL